MRSCACVSRGVLSLYFFLLLLILTAVTACQYGVSTPASPDSGSGSGSGGSGATSLTYTANIQPILASDCVRCHGPSRRDAGVDLSTYANVMKTVTPGNASSLLILVTRPGGVMYGEFRGSASTKSATIRDWIVTFGGAQ
jgi:hypothetical protein